MALAMSIKVVLKKVRDLAVTLAVLAVLFGMLMAINPRVREQFAGMTSTRAETVNRSGPCRMPRMRRCRSDLTTRSDNPFLFSFLVVAVVLFMLMAEKLI